MDEDVRALITTPFDLGGLDKDVGWCADRHALRVEPDGTILVHRSGDEEGARAWEERYLGSETYLAFRRAFGRA